MTKNGKYLLEMAPDRSLKMAIHFVYGMCTQTKLGMSIQSEYSICKMSNSIYSVENYKKVTKLIRVRVGKNKSMKSGS